MLGDKTSESGEELVPIGDDSTNRMCWLSAIRTRKLYMLVDAAN